MIEVAIHDLMLPVPEGREVKSWRESTTHDAVMAVWLREQEGERILKMWVDVSDGKPLVLGLCPKPTPRPMTFNLMARLLEGCGARLEKAAVTAFHDKIFHATMWVHAGGCIHEIDARPSDAFNLALRVQAPLFVASELFERMSLTPDELTQDMQGCTKRAGKELRSLLSRP